MTRPDGNPSPGPSTVSTFFSPETRLLVNSGNHTSPSAYFKKLSDRLYILEHEMAALKACQNTISLIYRLPPEVLCKIFLGVQEEEESTEYVSWLSVTHVCQHWRTIALGCTELWANLSFHEPELTYLMLERSGKAPLYIRYFDERCFGGCFCDVLHDGLSETSRLHTVDLDLEGRHIEDALPSSLAGAPLLEELSIYARDDSCTLPSKFFKGGAPRLSRLSLHECRFSWMTIPFSPAMTHLTLNSCYGEARPPAQVFITSFNQMPFLKLLDLSEFIPFIPESILPSSIPAASTASHLRDLRLQDTTEYLNNFFNLLRAPSVQKASFVIREQGTDLDVAALHQLLSSVGSSWRQNRRDKAISRAKKLEVGRGTSFMVWFHTDEKCNKSQPNLRLMILNHQGVRLPLRELLPTLHKDFDFSLLQELSLTASPSLTPDLVTASFGKLPELKELSVDDSVKIPDLLKLLSLSTERPLAPDTARGSAPTNAFSPVNFPKLSSIECRGTDFEDNGVRREANISTLISILKTRSQSHPIQRLSLQSCKNFRKAEKRLLSSGVPGLHVVWDGRESDLMKHGYGWGGPRAGGV